MDKLKRVLNGKEEDDEQGIVTQIYEGSTLNWSTRLKGFIICFVIGCLLSVLSTFALIFPTSANLKLFAVLYTLGNITAMSSSQKLKFEKTNKVKEQAISQGCAWHPSQSLLLVLCRDQLVLVDPARASTHKILVTSLHTITAGTWSLDGSKVIIALGMHLHVYDLNDTMELSLSRTIQNFSGPIRTLVSVTPDLVAIALDLPLEQLVCQCQTDMFEALPLADLRMESVSRNSSTTPAATCHQLEVKGHIDMPHSTTKDRKGDRIITDEILHKRGPVDINALIRRIDRNQTGVSHSDHQTIEESNQSQKHKNIFESDGGNKNNGTGVGACLPTGDACLDEDSKDRPEDESSLQEMVDLTGCKPRPIGGGSNKLVFKRTFQRKSQILIVGSNIQRKCFQFPF